MRGNILVVDDEAGPRESLRMILKQDHDVRTASGGVEALREIEAARPDLVIMDLRMPGMSGTELLQTVKTKYPDVEVAIITAYAAVDSARIAIRHGAIDYLTKPYAAADVVRIVDTALSLRRQQHDAAVLAAQVAKVTETVLGRRDLLERSGRTEIVEAVDGLRSLQTTLSDDMETVAALSQLGETAAEVTHDINNLLTVILGNSQYLLMQLDAQCDPQTDTVGRRVARIVQAATDCSQIIGRIKDFARVNIRFRPTLIDVNELVATAVDLKQEALSCSGEPAQFRVNLGPVVPIYGDEVALRTVLVNIIENSLEAEGVTSIEATTEFRSGRVHIRLRDDGCGMPPEVLANATQAFYTAGKPHGTGLGLSTADRVVQRHGGVLTITSHQGAGTCVEIELPLADERPGDEGGAAGAFPKLGAGPSAVASPTEGPKARTVIVVDDEDGIRELMGDILAAHGYNVLKAKGGLDGWALFVEQHEQDSEAPLMVLTDHEMPDLTGRELARRVKGVAPEVPVLLVSGYVPGGPEGTEDAFIAKPFDLKELLGTVDDLFVRARLSASPHLSPTT